MDVVKQLLDYLLFHFCDEHEFPNLNPETGNSLYRGKGMVPHVQLSINCGLGCFKNKTKYFLCTNSHFLGGLMTAQAVDPLPLFRDFPAVSEGSTTTSFAIKTF
jgi:hypothetical protein